MRINRNMLLKIANDTVDKYVRTDRTLLAIYLQGSLLRDDPLIGNTADIDLFMIHSDEVSQAREVLRVSDEISLDISHHNRKLYRQPRELRVDPWLGPEVYSCKIMYDPQHFLDFVQASVRGQFNNPSNVLSRVRKQADHARQMWESFTSQPRPPSPEDATLYLRALEHAANAFAGVVGQNLTERRFLQDMPARAEAMHKPGLYPGFLGLLGAPAVSPADLRSWLPEWQSAYCALPADGGPTRLHPYRWLYYEKAVEDTLNGPSAQDALWPLWRTWTHAISALPGDSSLRGSWQKAGEQLGLLGTGFGEKINGLDAYLDTVDEVLDIWGRENGG